MALRGPFACYWCWKLCAPRGRGKPRLWKTAGSGVVAAAAYSVGSSRDWQAVLPSDSIWDSPEETATLMLPGLSPATR